MKGKQYDEFCEKVKKRVTFNLEATEVEDVIYFVNFLKHIKKDNTNSMICERFKYEIIRRLDKYYQLNNKNEVFIENDEFVKALYLFNEYDTIDEPLLNSIFNHIKENINTFSIKELIELSLLFTEKNAEKHKQTFLGFFSFINDNKLRRNVKNMSNDLVYDIWYVYFNFDMMTNDIVSTILDNLLDNSTVNKDLEAYKFFSNKSMILKLSYMLDNFSITLNPQNAEKVNKLLSMLNEYFIKYMKQFKNDEIVFLINILSKHKLLDENILKQMLVNLDSNFDKQTIIGLANFYLNKNLEFDKKLIKSLEKMYLSSEFKIKLEIIILFIRHGHREFLIKENFESFDSSFEINKINFKDAIQYLWAISYFNIPSDNISKVEEYLVKNLDKAKISNFEIMLIVHSAKNLQDIKFDKLLPALEPIILEKLKEFEITDFVAIFHTYSIKKQGSDDFIQDFCDLMKTCIKEFKLIHVEILSDSLTNYQERLNKEQNEILEILNILKNMMKVKSLEKSVNSIDDEIIKECIRDYFNKSINYKKLI
jgi:hypothetical protein